MDRLLRLILAVTCILKSAEASQGVRINCGDDRYYDPWSELCVHCRVICLTDVESDFCPNNCPVYYKNMTKQKGPIDARQEFIEVLGSESTTKVTTAASSEFMVVSDVWLKVMMMVFAVCTVLLMILIVAAIINRSSIPGHSDARQNALCGCFLSFLDRTRRQKVEHQVDSVSVSDCSPTHSGTDHPLKLYESANDDSERRSLLPTRSLDTVSLLSSSHDDHRHTWSITALAAADGFVIQCTPIASSPSPPPQTQSTNSIAETNLSRSTSQTNSIAA